MAKKNKCVFVGFSVITPINGVKFHPTNISGLIGPSCRVLGWGAFRCIQKVVGSLEMVKIAGMNQPKNICNMGFSY